MYHIVKSHQFVHFKWYIFIHKLYLNKIIRFTEANSSFSYKIENILCRHFIVIQYLISSLILCIASYYKYILNFFYQVPKKWPQTPSNSFQWAILILWMPKKKMLDLAQISIYPSKYTLLLIHKIWFELLFLAIHVLLVLELHTHPSATGVCSITQ